ncbi:MAG: ribosomal L7Ae/L30e/S12e/Gadd45 family protein [Oscillospiraceae bacterium]|nr:ribosomal L7Ae/L30e/S12e/Gadd45 family protein [Oscillospiraceae bacterium]
MISESERARMQVGCKQAARALAEDKVLKVFLSGDSDKKISAPIEAAANEKNVDIFYVPTMKELGALCGIDVGASCAVILK